MTDEDIADMHAMYASGRISVMAISKWFNVPLAYEGSADHYLPLVYVLAQHREQDAVSFPVEGFDGGSISMLAVQVG